MIKHLLKKLETKKQTLLMLIIGCGFLVITSFAYVSKSASFHFVDEEDNIILGYYVNKGEKIYSDLFSHHQPMAYILSAGVQKVTSNNSIYLIIKRHREAIIIWSVVWSLLLIYRFGLVSLFSVLILELTKSFLLGNLFLSESLSIYPLLYIILFSIRNVTNYSSKEMMFLGICFSLCIFLLAPIWPLLILLGFAVFFKNINKNESTHNLTVGVSSLDRSSSESGKPATLQSGFYRDKVLFFGGGFALVFLFVLFYISPYDYLFNTFFINFKYYIPNSGESLFPMNLVNSAFSPITLLMNAANSPTMQIIKILTILMIVNVGLILKLKKYYLAFLIWIILILANFRFVQPGLEIYQGFHLLPWYACLIALTMYSAIYLSKTATLRLKFFEYGMIIFCIILSMYYSSQGLFQNRDKWNDLYINYSRQFDFGQAIKIMKSPGDKLFVAPDEWLIYYEADIPHASKMVNYYSWMNKSPELRRNIDNMFAQSKPTFFYCVCDEQINLSQYLKEYVQMKKDDKDTNLYVLPEKINSLTDDQRKQLRYFNFSVNYL